MTVYERGRSGKVYVRYAFGGQRYRRALKIHLRDASGQVSPAAQQAINTEQQRVLTCLLNGRDPFLDSTAQPSRPEWTLDRAFDSFLGPAGPSASVSRQQRRRYEQVRRETGRVFGVSKLATEFRSGDIQRYANERMSALQARGASGSRQVEIEVRCVLRVLKWLKYDCGVEDVRVSEHPSVLRALKAAQNPSRPRYTNEEAALLASGTREADPRLVLLLLLQDAQRAGQVIRCMRSHVRTVALADEGVEAVAVAVPGGNRKNAGSVLSPAAAKSLMFAMTHGYLRELERQYTEHAIDYPLFPGRIRRLVPDGVVPPGHYKPMGREFAGKLLRALETKVGVRHIDGRGFHGFRRRMVDVVAENGGTPEEIQAAGNWRTIQIPGDVYRSQQRLRQSYRASQRMAGHTLGDFLAKTNVHSNVLSGHTGPTHTTSPTDR